MSFSKICKPDPATWRTKDKILIVGATSALVAAFEPWFFEVNNVIILVRESTDKKLIDALGKNVIVTLDEDEALKSADVMFFASTHDGAKLIERFEGRTLYISSGFLTDVELKLTKANGYSKIKAACEAHAFTSIRPGYYLPSDGCRDTGRGLHRATGLVVFRKGPVPDGFDMTKAYYITCLKDLAIFCMWWLTHPEEQVRGTFSFGSSRKFTRQELRDGSDPQCKPIYADEMARTRDVLGYSFDAKDARNTLVGTRDWYKNKE